MGDRRNQGTLAVTTGRHSLLVLATLALAISGCATTVGRGQSELRAGRYTEAASNFEKALKEHPERARTRGGRMPSFTSGSAVSRGATMAVLPSIFVHSAV